MQTSADLRDPLINTPLQWGVPRPQVLMNRFNGFSRPLETVETVPIASKTLATPLKRGINENPLPLP
jgi:hypothetical protein